MRFSRWLVPAALAAVPTLAGLALADPTSPYLGPIVAELKSTRTAHASEFSPKVLSFFDTELLQLSAGGGGFRGELKSLQRIVKLAGRLGVNAPRARLAAALTGMTEEIQGNLDQLRSRAAGSAAAKNPSKLRRRIQHLLNQAQAALATARTPKPAAARVVQLLRAHGLLDTAVSIFGQVDEHVAFTWVTCDSIGPAGTPYVRGVNCREVLVDGYPRRFVVYVPQTALYQPGVPAPIVVMHHGSSGTGEQFLTHSGWTEEAELTGAVVAFPTGLQYRVTDSGLYSTKFNDFTLAGEVDLSEKPTGYLSATFPADDVKFEGKILDDLVATLPADPARLYACGFSNGGGFTGRLVVEMSDRFAAAGAQSGGVIQGVQPLAVRPIPFAIFFGTRDRALLDMINSPPSGTPPSPPYTEAPLDPAFLSSVTALEVVTAFTLHSVELTATPYTQVAEPLFTTFHWSTPAAGNTQGNTLELTVLAGVTHHFPSGPTDEVSENPNLFNEPALLWAFFNR